jgi:hypothetical protein
MKSLIGAYQRFVGLGLVFCTKDSTSKSRFLDFLIISFFHPLALLLHVAYKILGKCLPHIWGVGLGFLALSTWLPILFIYVVYFVALLLNVIWNLLHVLAWDVWGWAWVVLYPLSGRLPNMDLWQVHVMDCRGFNSSVGYGHYGLGFQA